MPRVALMATMPSRADTFKKVVEKMLPQVDLLYIFLDNFIEIPEFLLNNNKIRVNSSQEASELHSSGRFLPIKTLKKSSVLINIDDDIIYPDNYVSVLVDALAAYSGRAIVGVHARNFLPPYASYIEDVKVFHFTQPLAEDTPVDELGSGTCAFLSNVMNFGVNEWVYPDANDIQLALEAQKRGLPRICVKRPSEWLLPYAEGQSDSNWLKTQADCSRQTVLMRSLMRSPCGYYTGFIGATR